MPNYLGRQKEVGLALENVRGVAEPAAQHWLTLVDKGIIPMAEKVIDDSTFGRREDSLGQRIVAKWFEGDLGGVVRVNALGYYLKNLFGKVTTNTVVGGSVYTHKFEVLQGAAGLENDSLSIFIKEGDVLSKIYTGGVLASLGLTFSTDDYVRFSSSVSARKEASPGSPLTPTYTTDFDFIGRDISVKKSATLEGLIDAPKICVRSGEVTFTGNAIRNHCIGDRHPTNIFNGTFNVEGSLDMLRSGNENRDWFLNDNEYNYLLIHIEGEADLGGGNKPSISILLNRIALTDRGQDEGADDLASESLNFKGFYNTTDQQMVDVTLQNGVAAYVPSIIS